MYNRDIFSNFYFSKFNIIMWLKASQDDIINLICSKGNLKLHQWSVSFTFNIPTKSLKWTSNWPVAKLVEPCAQNACMDCLAGQNCHILPNNGHFAAKYGHSVQPNSQCMLCARISDTGLYSFCYRPICFHESCKATLWTIQ